MQLGNDNLGYHGHNEEWKGDNDDVHSWCLYKRKVVIYNSNVHDMFDMVEEKYSFCNGQNPTPKGEIKSSGQSLPMRAPLAVELYPIPRAGCGVRIDHTSIILLLLLCMVRQKQLLRCRPKMVKW